MVCHKGLGEHVTGFRKKEMALAQLAFRTEYVLLKFLWMVSIY